MRWALVAMATLSGCATFNEPADHHGHEAALTPTAASARVLVSDSDDLGRPLEVMALIDAHLGPEGRQAALEQLRARAAALGAEAVVGVEYHHGERGEPGHLSGMAVRFRDLLNGRSFDVLAELDIHAPMGHEGEAEEELKRRARALGADLILNVQFHHGEDDAREVRVTGRAVRFKPAT